MKFAYVLVVKKENGRKKVLSFKGLGFVNEYLKNNRNLQALKCYKVPVSA